MLSVLCVKCRNSSTGCLAAIVVDRKGATDHASSYSTAFTASLGVKSLGEVRQRTVAIELDRTVLNDLPGVELGPMISPGGEHAANCLAEVGLREIKAQTRILRSQLHQRLGNRIAEKDPLSSWIPRHAANCVSRYQLTHT